MSSHKIRVMVGTNFKREAVLINPNVSAAEPTINASNLSAAKENPNSNIIATGETSREILRKIYGRR